jgi:hypothetical protein
MNCGRREERSESNGNGWKCAGGGVQWAKSSSVKAHVDWEPGAMVGTVDKRWRLSFHFQHLLQSMPTVIYSLSMRGIAASARSTGTLLLVSFCVDVQLKTLRTKAYVIVNWGIFHVTKVRCESESKRKGRPILVFHFDC